MATLIVKNAPLSLRSERGVEIVEMAAVLPLLLLVMMGIVDFAFMFQRYSVITNAAMEGARVGSLPGYKIPGDVKARVDAYAASGGVKAASINVDAITVAVPAAGGGNWPAVQVTVTHVYTFQYLGPLTSLFSGSMPTVTLRARSTMRSQVGAGAG
jgi:Flp pilus assembly protein TadG